MAALTTQKRPGYFLRRTLGLFTTFKTLEILPTVLKRDIMSALVISASQCAHCSGRDEWLEGS